MTAAFFKRSDPIDGSRQTKFVQINLSMTNGSTDAGADADADVVVDVGIGVGSRLFKNRQNRLDFKRTCFLSLMTGEGYASICRKTVCRIRRYIHLNSALLFFVDLTK